jgi:hypothetical protein
MIDSGLDLLAAEDGAHRGEVTGVGLLEVDVEDMLGFDISPTTGVAIAVMKSAGTSAVYQIDLEMGRASFLADLNTDEVRGFAILGDPPPVPVRRASWGAIKAQYRDQVGPADQ